MTDNQIRKIRNEIPCKLTKEQKQLHRKLDCREMISSL